MPDWIPATYLRTEEAAPGLRTVVVQHEISRMRVPIRNAYKCAGQRASIRVNNGLEYSLAGPPPPTPLHCSPWVPDGCESDARNCLGVGYQ
jgi:hypothetical protein